MISVHFQGKPFNITVIQAYAPTSNTEEAEVEWFYEDLQDLLESGSEITQLCPTLCDPMECSLPGSSVHGIFQARILEWVAISFSRASFRPSDQTRVSFFTNEPPGKPQGPPHCREAQRPGVPQLRPGAAR